MSRKNFIVFVALAIAVFGAVVTASVIWMRGGNLGLSGAVTSTGSALVGGPFTLVDHTGREVTDETFHGRYALIYFGYTFCPDVCPATLQIVTAALDSLGDKADKIQPVFITVDPERDTVEQMSTYVGYFGDDMIGLTGSVEQVDEVARAYRVYYARAEDPSTTEYLMDHTSILYLMGPDGAFVKHFSYGVDPDELAAEIDAYVD